VSDPGTGNLRIDVPGASAPAAAAPLLLHLQRERGGPVLAREPVAAGDLADAVAEYWFEVGLRRRDSAPPLSELDLRVETVVRDDPDEGRFCSGFSLADPASPEQCRFFPFDVLAPVAARGAERLLAEGVIERGELYYFRLAELPEPTRVRGPEGRAAPSLAPLSLARVRERITCGERGEPGERTDEADYPVFFTRAARERAERVSRRGASARPAVESGGLLVGPLCRCPDTGELFALVTEVLEATDSEASGYSLTYSGATWSRIQGVLRARATQPATRHHRVLGQTHGHNFLPFDGAEPCEACSLVEVCTRTSASLSEDDRIWARSVFSAEPWQLSQVFGLDARSHPCEAFYGQRRGQLARRSYQLIDAVDPGWFA